MLAAITSENFLDIVPVFIQSYNQPPWNYHWNFDKAAQYLAEYMSCDQFVGFILYDQGEAVGGLLGHTKTWWTGDQMMIDELFVSAQKQKMGYGKTLIQHCEQYAAERNIGTMILMTNKYMPSYQFYNKLEYTATEQFVLMFKQVSRK